MNVFQSVEREDHLLLLVWSDFYEEAFHVSPFKKLKTDELKVLRHRVHVECRQMTFSPFRERVNCFLSDVLWYA